MKNIILFGKNSSIGKILRKEYNVIYKFDRTWPGFNYKLGNNDLDEALTFIDKLDVNLEYTFIYCSSILYSKNFGEQTLEEIHDSYHINTVVPIKLIRKVNSVQNLKFNFHYIGSESARKGSYDCSYAITKKATQDYIIGYRLNNSDCRSIVWAPSTMSGGMTERREDVDRLNDIRLSLPSKRFLEPAKLIKMISEINNNKFMYVTNTLIEVNNGKFSTIK